MGILKSNLDNQICQYDFSEDGGAIGTYRLGLFLDQFSCFNNIWMNVTTAFTSAAGTATVSIGVRVANTADSPVFIMNAVLANAGPFVVNAGILGLRSIPTFEVIFSIGVEPLTAGTMLIYMDYFNSDK